MEWRLRKRKDENNKNANFCLLNCRIKGAIQIPVPMGRFWLAFSISQAKEELFTKEVFFFLAWKINFEVNLVLRVPSPLPPSRIFFIFSSPVQMVAL